MSINTKQWMEAGLPFEVWLRYAAAPPEAQAEAEALFATRYPELMPEPQPEDEDE